MIDKEIKDKSMYDQIAEKIKAELKKQNISASRLANRTGVDRNKFYYLFTGKRKLWVHELCNIAEVLNKDISYFIGEGYE